MDFVKGVATAITPMAFFETVMVKGYEALVDSGTTVDVSTGMLAAGRLQALIESRASGTRVADLMVQMSRIIDAIHSTVPEQLWPEILRKIDGPVAADTPADEFEDCDDAEGEHDPWNPFRQRRTAGLSAHGENDHRPHVHRACSDTRSPIGLHGCFGLAQGLVGIAERRGAFGPGDPLAHSPYARPTHCT